MESRPRLLHSVLICQLLKVLITDHRTKVDMMGLDGNTQLGLKIWQHKELLTLFVLLCNLFQGPSSLTSRVFHQDHSLFKANVHAIGTQNVNNLPDLMETSLQFSRITEDPSPMKVV